MEDQTNPTRRGNSNVPPRFSVLTETRISIHSRHERNLFLGPPKRRFSPPHYPTNTCTQSSLTRFLASYSGLAKYFIAHPFSKIGTSALLEYEPVVHLFLIRPLRTVTVVQESGIKEYGGRVLILISVKSTSW